MCSIPTSDLRHLYKHVKPIWPRKSSTVVNSSKAVDATTATLAAKTMVAANRSEAGWTLGSTALTNTQRAIVSSCASIAKAMPYISASEFAPAFHAGKMRKPLRDANIIDKSRRWSLRDSFPTNLAAPMMPHAEKSQSLRRQKEQYKRLMLNWDLT